MGLFGKKNGKRGRPSSTISQEPLTPRSLPSQKAEFNNVSALEQKDLKYKRRIRILRFITRLVSLILSGLMSGIFIYTLFKYYTTKNHVIPSTSTNPWANPALLWPTFVLMGISLITFFMNLVTLIAYCCGVGAANKTYTCSSVIGYIFLGVHVVIWFVAAGAYKVANVKGNGKDLWGYSCGDEADAIQAEVQSFLDFGKLCTMQGGAWFASVIEAGFYLLTFIVTILVARRAATKKKMNKIRQSMSIDSSYQNPQGSYGNVELGTLYSPGLGKKYMPVSKDSAVV